MNPEGTDILGEFLPRLIKPVATLCVRRGLRFQEFLDAAKQAFTSAAEQELRRQQEAVNVSRLSVMTGLQRKDIKRLKEISCEEKQASLLARIMGHWQSHPQFCTKGGKPRILQHEGSDSDFVHLVHEISTDINPYTVLFELERVKAVSRTSRGVKLNEGALSISDDIPGGLTFLADDALDLYLSVEENLFDRNTVPHLHIRTSYDDICMESLPKIQLWLLEKGAQFHAQARKFISQFDREINPKLYDKEGGARVTLGSISYSTDQREEQD
ncbi:DUF6502 family protein [bacterium]|nr:DUF6502 family protein [bacterium]